jgi:hypothetical protein
MITAFSEAESAAALPAAVVTLRWMSKKVKSQKLKQQRLHPGLA